MKSLRSMGIFLVICFIVIVLVLADRAYGNDIIRADAEAVSSVEIQAVPDIWSSGRIVITEADKVDKLIKVLNSFEYDGYDIRQELVAGRHFYHIIFRLQGGEAFACDIAFEGKREDMTVLFSVYKGRIMKVYRGSMSENDVKCFKDIWNE